MMWAAISFIWLAISSSSITSSSSSSIEVRIERKVLLFLSPLIWSAGMCFLDQHPCCLQTKHVMVPQIRLSPLNLQAMENACEIVSSLGGVAANRHVDRRKFSKDPMLAWSKQANSRRRHLPRSTAYSGGWSHCYNPWSNHTGYLGEVLHAARNTLWSSCQSA